MKHVEYHDIDKVRWDEAVNRSSNGNIFNLSWYLDAVCHKWNGLIFGDYDAVMPIPVVNKLNVSIVYQPFFSRQTGVFGPGKVHDALAYLGEHHQKVDIGFDKTTEIPNKFEVAERRHQVLDIGGDYESIQKNYSTNAKRLIKKSYDTFRIESSSNIMPLVDHFKGLAEDKGIRLDSDSASRLKALMEACMDHDAGINYLIYENDTLMGGVFFMLFRKTVILLKNFTTDAGKQNGAMYKLIDHAVKELGGRYELLDFGGSDVESVAGFNKKFGATDAFYIFLSLDQSPAYFKLLRSVRNKIKKY